MVFFQEGGRLGLGLGLGGGGVGGSRPSISKFANLVPTMLIVQFLS